MSIVDLLEIDSTILAVSDAGQVVLWDLSEIQKINGAYFFKDNVSLLASKGSLRIGPDSLRGIKMHRRNIVMYFGIKVGSTRRLSTSRPTNKSCSALNRKEWRISPSSTLEASSKRKNWSTALMLLTMRRTVCWLALQKAGCTYTTTSKT